MTGGSVCAGTRRSHQPDVATQYQITQWKKRLEQRGWLSLQRWKKSALQHAANILHNGWQISYKKIEATLLTIHTPKYQNFHAVLLFY